ncbi:MAG TPA: hypothetical protein DCL21_06465 [Alphaproteobacteria bacterium]|nr:hypothetical protein [Alphaproteobacteria bacterium]
MKKIMFFICLTLSFISFNSFAACTEPAGDWRDDYNSNPWEMDKSVTIADGYWEFNSPNSCIFITDPKKWIFIKKNKRYIDLYVSEIKGFKARQERLINAGEKPRNSFYNGLCKVSSGSDWELSAKRESRYKNYQYMFQYEVEFMIANGYLTMEDYSVLPECPPYKRKR